MQHRQRPETAGTFNRQVLARMLIAAVTVAAFGAAVTAATDGGTTAALIVTATLATGAVATVGAAKGHTDRWTDQIRPGDVEPLPWPLRTPAIRWVVLNDLLFVHPSLGKPAYPHLVEHAEQMPERARPRVVAAHLTRAIGPLYRAATPANGTLTHLRAPAIRQLHDRHGDRLFSQLPVEVLAELTDDLVAVHGTADVLTELFAITSQTAETLPLVARSCTTAPEAFAVARQLASDVT